MTEKKLSDAEQVLLDSLMEELEAIQMEAEDIIPDFRRVISRHTLTDHIEVAGMMNAITMIFVEFFLDNSLKGKMDETTILTHWVSIATGITQMIKVGYQERQFN